jgi:hypothetical protein
MSVGPEIDRFGRKGKYEQCEPWAKYLRVSKAPQAAGNRRGRHPMLRFFTPRRAFLQSPEDRRPVLN